MSKKQEAAQAEGQKKNFFSSAFKTSVVNIQQE